MDFVTAVKTCFAKYVDWHGRALRSEFWWWTLFTFIASILLSILDAVIFGYSFESGGILDTLFSLATLLPTIFVTTRRLHDVGRSGWWQLIVFTIIGIFVLLYWLIIEGDQGDNDYGPHPLGAGSEDLGEVFR
ncbi:DUF805 domain-containing protein [Amylibacter sp. IMCC11727]|uniref:DUF805 domain-containing protein n=1 Tax=Amylibacter sp. IMCC11727 TaxID=3039851 RepID=UPI00244DC963|nr:DUF805 domain-containing protein [Amylibacter sp. IMCC11727]WGI22744.1 DUF805 domain-containing protein [Amylibacter sp. IMCC11727]